MKNDRNYHSPFCYLLLSHIFSSNYKELWSREGGGGGGEKEKARNKASLQFAQKSLPAPWCAANLPTRSSSGSYQGFSLRRTQQAPVKLKFQGRISEHLQSLSPIVTMNAAFRPFSHFSYLSANKIQHIHVKNTETKALQTTLSSMLIISYSICYLAQR